MLAGRVDALGVIVATDGNGPRVTRVPESPGYRFPQYKKKKVFISFLIIFFLVLGESVTGRFWYSRDMGSIPVGYHYNPGCVHTARKHGARISRGEI